MDIPNKVMYVLKVEKLLKMNCITYFNYTFIYLSVILLILLHHLPCNSICPCITLRELLFLPYVHILQPLRCSILSTHPIFMGYYLLHPVRFSRALFSLSKFTLCSDLIFRTSHSDYIC